MSTRGRNSRKRLLTRRSRVVAVRIATVLIGLAVVIMLGAHLFGRASAL